MGIKVGTRRSLETRVRMRDAAHVSCGRQPGWTDEALDFFLDGEPVPEILRAFEVSTKAFYNGIAKAALFRLMKQQNVQLMAEMGDLTDGMANGILKPHLNGTT